MSSTSSDHITTSQRPSLHASRSQQHPAPLRLRDHHHHNPPPLQAPALPLLQHSRSSLLYEGSHAASHHQLPPHDSDLVISPSTPAYAPDVARSLPQTSFPEAAHNVPAHRHAYWSLDPQDPSDEQGTQPASQAPYDDPSMRYTHAADLSAPHTERYDDGRQSWQHVGPVAIGGKASIAPPGSGYDVRKRGRKQSAAEPEEPEDERKRARGRPRLDTKDQTPAERRRTQIRLAQRAYRSRKENAISELETTVQGLKDMNDEIKDACQAVFNYASRQGILDSAPDFARHLKKLHALSTRSPSRVLNDGDVAAGVDSEDSGRGGLPTLGRTFAHSDISPSESKVDPPQALWGGIMVSHEPVMRPHVAASNMGSSMDEGPVEYEIMAAPTPANASFASPIAYEQGFLAASMQSQWSNFPWGSLPNPATMSYLESGFARRLYRHTKERAAQLITMDNPPGARMTRVFGFARLFETLEQIKERTLDDLRRTRNEPLFNYNYPFHNLGGSGTHFPDRVKSIGTCASPHGDRHATPGRIGPLDPQARIIRDRLLELTQHIRMPGLTGNFLDCDEVELYLAQNGVVVSSMDFQQVEIGPTSFQNREESAVPGTPAPPPTSTGPPSMAVPQPVSNGQHAPSDVWPPVASTSASSSATFLGNNAIPSFDGPSGTNAPFSAPSVATFSTNGGHFSNGTPMSSLAPSGSPRKAMLNVDTFLLALSSHAVCLGRTPGFRAKHVDQAFWESVTIE